MCDVIWWRWGNSLCNGSFSRINLSWYNFQTWLWHRFGNRGDFKLGPHLLPSTNLIVSTSAGWSEPKANWTEQSWPCLWSIGKCKYCLLALQCYLLWITLEHWNIGSWGYRAAQKQALCHSAGITVPPSRRMEPAASSPRWEVHSIFVPGVTESVYVSRIATHALSWVNVCSSDC